MKSEAAIVKQAMLDLSRRGRVWRNNVGVTPPLPPDGRRVVYGLCPGSADLIGYEAHEVTPEDVGRVLPVFLACEVKTPSGRLSSEQRAFLAHVHGAGGRALIRRGTEFIEYKEI